MLYRLGTAAYFSALKLASLFNAKAALGIKGRKESERKILNWEKDKNRKRILFHCASLGEFEQARPIIEKVNRDKYQIILSFFSPSGYEIRKDYEHADLVIYLPFDSPANAKFISQSLDISIAVFVKYEFWFYTLQSLYRQGVKIYLISARFRKEQIFFKSWGKLYRQMLGFYEHIFVQDKPSLALLEALKVKNVTLAGDTRFDRVSENSSKAKSHPAIQEFIGDNISIIGGSTWQEEEEMIAEVYSKLDAKWILAPHDIGENHLNYLKKRFHGDICFLSSGVDRSKTILVIDSIGMLANAYSAGDIALVGGGFKRGLHNILEPAVFGLAVVFGPKTEKYPEGDDLVKEGGGFKFSDAGELKQILQKLISDEAWRKESGQKAGEWIKTNIGAAERIMKQITLD